MFTTTFRPINSTAFLYNHNYRSDRNRFQIWLVLIRINNGTQKSLLFSKHLWFICFSHFCGVGIFKFIVLRICVFWAVDWRKIAEDWNQDLAVTCHVCYAIDAISWGLVYQSLLVGDAGKNTMMFCPIKKNMSLVLLFSLCSEHIHHLDVDSSLCIYEIFLTSSGCHVNCACLFWTDTDTGCSAPCNNQPPVSLGKDYFVD